MDAVKFLGNATVQTVQAFRLPLPTDNAYTFQARTAQSPSVIEGVMFMRLSSRLGVCALASFTLMAVSPVPAQADEVRENQWMLGALGIDKVHDISKGEGVTVGIVDSGVDATHPDLTGNVEPGVASWSGGEDGLKDTIGHGTAMASLIVGHGHGENGEDGVLGVAPKAKLKSVSIYPTNDPRDDPSGSSERLIDGIRWLADEGVDVISVSQGDAGTEELEEAVKYAVEEKDIPLIAAAGNDTGDLGGDPFIGYPAAYEQAFSVTGTTAKGEFWKGSADGLSASDVTVAAPAENVVHAWNDHGYDDNSGTSDSAAIVAGTVALMKAQWPDMAWEDIEWRLTETADDKGKEGPDDKFGFGIVNPYEALTAHVDPPDGVPDEQINPEPNPKANSSEGPTEDDKALTASSGPGAALWISTAAVVAVLASAVVTLVIIRRRKQTPKPPPMG